MFEASEIFRLIEDYNSTTPSKVRSLLADNPDAHKLKSSKGETFLHLISKAYKGDNDGPKLLPVVFQLSNAGVDRNAQNADGNTALHIAAAKGIKSRLLLRALFMIGVDPGLKNKEKEIAEKICANNPDVVSIFRHFSPGLWKAVATNSESDVERLLASWCKVDETRDGVTMTEMAETKGHHELSKKLIEHENTVKLVHHIFAREKKVIKDLMKRDGVDINVTTTCGVDKVTGELVTVPLVAEATLLNLRYQTKKLLKKGAKVADVFVREEPMLVYVLKNLATDGHGIDAIEPLLKATKFKKMESWTTSILDAAYKVKLPFVLLKLMTTRGLDFFQPDENGHFLRDRILIQNIEKKQEELKQELMFADQMVVDVAGQAGVLESLVFRGYDYIDVVDSQGRSSREELSSVKGPEFSERFFSEMLQLSKTLRYIGKRVEAGIQFEVKSLVTQKLSKGRDRIGRTFIHKAVLFGHRFVLNHFVKISPQQAKVKDVRGRSPLHWACLLDDGDDIQASLQVLGCTMTEPDKYGKTPADFKQLDAEDRLELLTEEKHGDYGLDIYLYQKYTEMKEGIRQGSLPMVEDTRSTIYRDVQLEQMTSLMYQTEPPQKSLLLFAMDARRDAIAKFLLTQGMHWDIKYQDGEEETTLLEAAQRKHMKGVIEYIQHQLKRRAEEAEMLRRLREAGVNGAGKSCSCIIL